jgi:hypothetical protein
MVEGGGPLDPSACLRGFVFEVKDGPDPLMRTLFASVFEGTVEGVSATFLSFVPSLLMSDKADGGRITVGVPNIEDSFFLMGPGVLPAVPRTPNFRFN